MLTKVIRNCKIFWTCHLMRECGGFQAPDSSLVHAYGIISNPYKEIDSFHSLYGSQKGKTFAIWADRIRTMEISDDSWVVRFDKWQRTGLTFFFLCLFIQAYVCQAIRYFFCIGICMSNTFYVFLKRRKYSW